MNKLLYASLIADKVYEENFKEMDDVEFFGLSNEELEEKILPHLKYLELMDNVKAELRTYFDY